MNLILKRTFQNRHKTLGNLFLFDGGRIICMLKTLELPWKNNQRRVSCIPEGTYNVKVHQSPKFGWCLWIQDVPGRSEILIHVGNYTRQILGCVLSGVMHDDIDNDGIMDVKHSGVAMETLQHYIGTKKDLIITIRK